MRSRWRWFQDNSIVVAQLQLTLCFANTNSDLHRRETIQKCSISKYVVSFLAQRAVYQT